jgi:hypothetical protein
MTDKSNGELAANDTETICRRLTEGETLRAICKTAGMPDERTVRRWALDDVDGFGARYERARFFGYMTMFDEIIAISDERCADTVEAQRNRLRVDTRKWALAKALPKIFGDKVETTTNHQITDENDQPLDLNEMARRIAFLLTAGAAGEKLPPSVAAPVPDAFNVRPAATAGPVSAPPAMGTPTSSPAKSAWAPGRFRRQ